MSQKPELVRYGDNHFARVNGILRPISKAKFDELADKHFESTVTPTPPTPAKAQTEKPAPVTATPEAATPAETAPEGNAYLDRMRALQAEGLPVHTAALQAAKEHPEAFKRLKGEL
ncbi:MAG: hypothetical protein GX580_14675 [Candidatus Hydrogenedens sp.]|nr:hypothetical protein [Candidatus Hydrogenedens sp.]